MEAKAILLGQRSTSDRQHDDHDNIMLDNPSSDSNRTKEEAIEATTTS
jgi:hypothetical protein